ncbi:hypothetical protein [Antrihabitans cavernicola]|uniref:ESX-1 secretion-associated protein n=1 Tax=Antrihabitans cavernicola TaxID=2495913 RepID=A0A5A7SB60_9NOCA|nr:hypothetical protein [Spelaeibacter cavernicola]KAA0022764.1 hypothetical protein FOY51_13910 [Spelaeibacter cavernicola]
MTTTSDNKEHRQQRGAGDVSEFAIDPAAVRAVAGALDASSGVVAECGRSVGEGEFGSHCAGRDYAEHGHAVQSGLASLGSVLTASANSGSAAAAALHATVDGYTVQDRASSDALGQVL